MAEITVTKLDAARRQLRTAIEFWFAGGDPVSTHTLTCAAYQIVHDLNERRKGPREPLLLDVPSIKKEYKSIVRASMKEPGNFMKHGKRGKAGDKASIEFNPELTTFFIIFTIQGLIYLKEDLSAEEQAFNFWQRLHRSELFTDAWQDLLKNGVDQKALAGMRALPKQEFFEYVREILTEDPTLLRS